MAANDDLLDAIVRHESFLLRFGGSITARRILPILDAADRDLVVRISERLEEIQRRGIDPGPATTKRLQALLAEIRELSGDLRVALGDELRDALDDVGDLTVSIAAQRINEVVGIDLDMVRPAPDLLRSIVTTRPFQGRLLKDWLKDLESGRVRRAFSTVQRGIVEGQTNAQIVRAIRGTRSNSFRDGILETGRRGAEALVRTSINHVTNHAREALYERNRDLIDEVRWTATLDGRTTSICRGRDGRTYPIGSGPRPPAHVNCRSVMVPVLKSWDDLLGRGKLQRGRGAESIDTLMRKRLAEKGKNASEIERILNGTRASMNGQVPAKTTYGEWLVRQPAKFQDDVLGIRKGRLFRDGKLPVDRFVDLKTGRPFNLEELRRTEGQAWMRAGLKEDGPATVA